MSEIRPWRDRPGHPCRYTIMDGTAALGTVFVSNGCYTTITASGYLLGIFPDLDMAAQALARSSS